MKYLKMIVTNPWIILMIILTLYNAFHAYDTSFNFTSFTFGLLVLSLVYAIIDKLRYSIRRRQIEKLDRMSRASSVILCDEEGNQVKENNGEYARGFREASTIILRDLE